MTRLYKWLVKFLDTTNNPQRHLAQAEHLSPNPFTAFLTLTTASGYSRWVEPKNADVILIATVTWCILGLAKVLSTRRLFRKHAKGELSNEQLEVTY